MIRIAHLSDIHFGDENAAAVEAATAWLAADPPDLTIVSGDLTRFGEKDEFATAAAWLRRLPEPRLVTPGNHDAPYLAWVQRLFRPFARYEAVIGPAEAVQWLGQGLAVYGLNTARGVQPRANWSKGQISARQVDAALAWFAKAPTDWARILVVHHPLVEMIGAPMTGRVWGGAAAAARLAQAGIAMVLSGHVHAPFLLPFPQGRMAAVGAGTLSVRERGVPASFNLIEIDEAEIRVSALAWTGTRFEPFRAWGHTRGWI
ncbi:MAG TPA: metallophosphoesterase [Phenylobacterium sp.]|nr:metallophosphoesterase [Phenylobacterium sp.]HQN51354.1 metallophosphoesterase [Phenylobacterium sp.]HQP20660.1 metallophosphoesterase [Phenylobacterium sp.]